MGALYLRDKRDLNLTGYQPFQEPPSAFIINKREGVNDEAWFLMQSLSICFLCSKSWHQQVCIIDKVEVGG